jgi:hypothetical protein
VVNSSHDVSCSASTFWLISRIYNIVIKIRDRK